MSSRSQKFLKIWKFLATTATTVVEQNNNPRKGDDAMETSMNPSEVATGEQIGKVQDILGAGLRKADLPKEPFQKVIETQGGQLVAELVAVVRKYVEMVSDLIIRRVNVNRGRTPQEVLDATGRKQYTDSAVVAKMPPGEGGEQEVFFFQPDKSAYVNRLISDDELAKQFELRGFKPADSYAVAAVNEADPVFADDHPNGTHWKDSSGKWCYIAFFRWGVDERSVDVRRSDNGWSGSWWFAGVCK